MPPAQEKGEQDKVDELLDLAYNAAAARLTSQTDAFESLRTRASGILAVAALVTSFASGVGLFSTDPSKGKLLPLWALWTLLGILVVLGCCAISILLPTQNWSHDPSARIILERRTMGEPPVSAKAYVTGEMIKAQRCNSDLL